MNVLSDEELDVVIRRVREWPMGRGSHWSRLDGPLAEVCADPARGSPAVALAEYRESLDPAGVARAHGDLCALWALVTGRASWVGDLNLFPGAVAERLEKHAAGRPIRHATEWPGGRDWR